LTEPAEPRLRSPAPATPQEALARAREHGRAAAAEALAALQALLEAAALSTTGRSSDAHVVLGPAARLLGGLAEELEPGGRRASESLLASVTEALDAEIARWEQRARDDPDARAVLRAFLGLREVLWEFGVRPGRAPEEGRGYGGSHPVGTRRSRRPRVQRVSVEG
jgi:hypothetical protein